MVLEARPVEWAEPAFFKFLKLDPSDDDRRALRAMFDHVEEGKQSATPVMFAYPQKSYLVVLGNWRIIVEERPNIWYVTYADNKMHQ